MLWKYSAPSILNLLGRYETEIWRFGEEIDVGEGFVAVLDGIQRWRPRKALAYTSSIDRFEADRENQYQR